MATNKDSKTAARTPDTYEFGHALASEYFKGLRGTRKNDAVDALKKSATCINEEAGFGECMRGFLEGLAERYYALVRQPDRESPTVQQTLEQAAEAAREASLIVDCIRFAADEYSDREAMLSLVAHSAQLGVDVIAKVEGLIEKVQQHRTEAGAA